tara:strand:+ start:1540 stop:1902 length:363 start_codon:yes stop_codon:yes gene_type:complete
MNRHSIDENVLNFVIEKFNKQFKDENSFSYIYTDKDIKIEISKGQILKSDKKITMDLFKLNKNNDDDDPFNTRTDKHMNYELSINCSNKLRKFIESKEDELNSDYIRNKNEEVLEFINNN